MHFVLQVNTIFISLDIKTRKKQELLGINIFRKIIFMFTLHVCENYRFAPKI